jgi:hypothetical protein
MWHIKINAVVSTMKRTIRLFIVLTLFWLFVLPGGMSKVVAESVVSISVVPNPLINSISAPDKVALNQKFEIQATIQNLGDINVENVSVLIYPSSNIKLIKANELQDVGTLLSHSNRVISWQVKITKEGKYILSIVTYGTYQGNTISDEDTCLITALKKMR